MQSKCSCKSKKNILHGPKMWFCENCEKEWPLNTLEKTLYKEAHERGALVGEASVQRALKKALGL